MFEGKKILVLGLAKSGLAVIKLLAGQCEIIATDKNEQSTDVLKILKDLNVTFISSATGEEILDESFDYLIKNPGIEPTQACVKKANSLNIPVINEMEVAYHYLPKNIKIIGVTGSNGKTTTTTMLYDLLKLHHLPVTLGGNIGTPLSDVINDIKENGILLLEISDHQLYNLNDFKTNYSVLTNLCPTHLDFHGNYDNYKMVKKKIFNHHTENDIAIINYQNKDSMLITEDIPSKKVYFNNDVNYYNEKGIYIDNELVLELNEIKIKGNHNYENILASLLVLRDFAWNIDIIKKYFQEFGGVEHRIEIVNNSSLIEFYNDSKSTNPTSTVIALKTMTKPTHLILGGKEREQDFNELNDEIKVVKKIYAIGEVSERIKKYADSINIPCEICQTLTKAMQKIKENVKENECVLLSPGSASWDQYDKFETRGEEFKKLVEKLFK